ncbi:MAG: hypothetical protein JWR59_838 [Brevundimonas sp.]|jgi:hypothetical protein|nr:hypothetical protein [Brevundimonas sp.]
MAHPILDRLSDPKVRWWIAGGVVLLALAVGGFALAGRGGAVADTADGPGLNIAVVAPVEPDIQPGDVMDVGVLNNGFDGRLPERAQGVGGDDLYVEQPAYDEGDQGWRAEDRWAPGARPSQVQTSNGQNYVRPGPDGAPYSNAQPRQRETYDDRGQGRPMSFGFDRPQPDWRAEREARRAALDAREQARDQERNARRYSSSGDPRYDRSARDSDNY